LFPQEVEPPPSADTHPGAAPLTLMGRRPRSPVLGEPFFQHSVNTQYYIKAINSHFKETETQFSHQSQEQWLAGLRNVTAQLAAPPPPPQSQLEGGRLALGCARLHCPSPQVRLPWWGPSLASSSRELKEAREAGGGTLHSIRRW
jgi:hypothetical protein